MKTQSLMKSVPKIDRLAGMECYCTDFRGIGGSIRKDNEGFRVSEIINESVFVGLSPVQDNLHKYPLYLLEKKGIDSHHALVEIKKDLGLDLRIMGMKDAKATTRQYASSTRIDNVPMQHISRSKHTFLTLKGFTSRPVGKESLLGNEFSITIYDVKHVEMSEFRSEVEKVGNFYGLQRFGSERLVTHLVGREIVKRNFKKAAELLLSYTTEYDSAMSREIRQKSLDPKNYRNILNRLPKGMDIEFQLMNAFVNGKEPISALRSISINIRRLFVHAYQAYIFNKCLSDAIVGGENLQTPCDNDLCFELERPLTFGRIRKFNPSIDRKTSFIPALRLAGYSFQSGKGRFELITKKIMNEENVTPRDFYIKEMQELSDQGGFRQALLCCRDFAYKGSLDTYFKLPKGSYATTLLREIMKPEDPVKAGF
ncbi:MAG TPA: tRNA pseudouridine(13) synthase TruD [Nitrososphaeraceae archaeon]|nr:tRNA pseudouridine(13) synthase TruD [Nitrososphaeraceae archaeon]